MVIFTCLAANLWAQNPSFNVQKLGSEEGLNNANIFNIEQHENDLMYFTTQNGIYYYDGYNCNKLQIDSLKSNALLAVSIKNRDQLYLSLSDEGIALFNLKTNEYGPVKQLRVKNNNADYVFVTEKYAYLLTSGIKLLMVDMATGAIIPDEVKKNNKSDVAYCVYQTKNGKILVGRSSGLYEVLNGRQIKMSAVGRTAVHAITETRDGKLILGTAGKLLLLYNETVETEITPTYNTKSNTFQPGGDKSIDKIICDSYGRIWFTASPGEELYLYQNNRVYNIFESLDIPPTLINCLFKDNRENLWIGTFSDGVYYIQNTFFDGINFSFNNKNLNVNQVYLSNNLLIAATSNGLYALNLSTNQTKVLSKPDETFMEPVTGIIPLNGALYYTKRNQFEMSPAIFFDAENSYKFKPIIARQFYSLNQNQSVLADWSANVLLCNADGSQVLDTLISFSDYRISVNDFLKEDNLLYIATNKGLFKYDFKTRKYQNMVRSELNYNINDIAIVDKKLYAAHEAGITDIYNGKLIQQVGKFRLNSVKKIKQYKQQIWLATLDGIFVCDSKFDPVKTINKSNGLLSNSVNDITFTNDRISIATDKGVATTAYKNIAKYNARLKPISIKSIVCNGQHFGSENNTYFFNADEENITISFYSPLYNRPNKQFYRWRTDGEDWNYITNPSFEVLLTGGSHRIDISASADDILWSDPTVLTIVKEEKLSEKRGIYGLITLGGMLIIALISFIWIRRVKIKAKKRLRDEQQVNLLKHQAMNALLSPHFIFNSLTSIQNYINTNNSLRASEYLAKFSRLIRMIIEKAAQSEISLHDELARLTYYLELEKERFKNKFDYRIELDENINTHEIMIPNMIIQPYVENSLLHGILPKQSHGELIIQFKHVGNKRFQIIIEDDGIGFIKAGEHSKPGHKSLGTSTIKDILEINSKLNGKKQNVKMIDKTTLLPPGNGTIITIEIEL